MTAGIVDGYVVIVPDSESTLLITRLSDSVTSVPSDALNYESELPARNEFYDLIGGGDAVSLVTAGPREGELTLLYRTEVEAFAATNLHAAESLFTFSDSAHPSQNMTYALRGRVRPAIENTTRRMWVVTVGYREVS